MNIQLKCLAVVIALGAATLIGCGDTPSRSTANKSSDKSTAGKSSAGKSTAGKSTAEKSSGGKSTAEKSTAGKSDTGKSADHPDAPGSDAGESSLVGKKSQALVGPHDWNQWGGSPQRNNVPDAKNLPDSWNPRQTLFDCPANTEFEVTGAADMSKEFAELIEKTGVSPGVKGRMLANAPDAKTVQVQVDQKKIEVNRSTAEQLLANFDGPWKPGTGKNIKWVARLGSQTYGNPVVANGQAYVGTNNGAGWVKKYPYDVDLGCLLCFSEKDGSFLWQHSNEKLPEGKVRDWEQQGVCATALVEGDRLWYVSNRGVVNCLDTKGFRDGKNDGPYKDEPADLLGNTDADVVWEFDMIAKLGLFQHNMCACSVTAVGDLLFVCTSNGVDDSHANIPAPNCPAFICLNKNTGEYYWGDASPGLNILHGQWSSPAYAVLGGVPQIIFGGGDAWLHSFRADKGKDGKPESLWSCDLNPKRSKWIIGGRGTRNEVISTPVIYKDRIYICVGQDPEHGEGEGHLWCIDPVKQGDKGPELRRGDISPELVLDDKGNVIPHRRIQAALDGDAVKPNPNSGIVWHYGKFDQNGDGKIDFEEELHRSIGTVAIKDDILYLADFSGLFHCVDAKTGKPHWTYDMLSASWGSALIADGKVFIGDDDGDVAVFVHSADKDKAMHKNDAGEYKPIHEINMGTSVYSTPIAANDTLFISTKTHLFAIAAPAK